MLCYRSPHESSWQHTADSTMLVHGISPLYINIPRHSTSITSALVSQGLDVHDFFHSFRGQHQRVFLADRHAVLDPDAESAERLGPPLVVGHVDAGLDGDAVPLLQRDAARVAWHVVDVEANVVPHVVWEQDVHGVAAELEAQLLQLVPQRRLRDAVELVQRDTGVGAAHANTRALGCEHSFIEIPLRLGELARHGPRPRDICDVGTILSTGVNENKLVVVQQPVVEDVMNEKRLLSAGDDGDISRSV